ncbi:MAG: NlpC/P60 family protein [Thermodesulfobacteriota bacterium]
MLSSCSDPKKTVQSPPANSYHFSQEEHYKTINKLYCQLKDWQGVPHSDGGMSKKGVDCSGFIHRSFRELFDVRLPRTTSQLAHTGEAVSKVQLQPGDLVFFKVNMGTRHVAIYVENQKFIHASKSKGVMISRLDNPHWLKHYWQARRVAHL